MIMFRRLQVLETFLRTRAPQLKGRFDLETWVFRDHAVIDKLFCHTTVVTDLTANPKTMDCGFAGCAIGWAAVLPSFQRLGLSLTRDDTDPQSVVYPAFRGYTSFAAVQQLFGIDYNTATYLFLDTKYTSEESKDPLAVAARIRKFIAANVPADSPCKYIAKHLQESN